MLDLTASQQIAALTLRYELSNVVAHSGDFVTINVNVESAEEYSNEDSYDEEGRAEEESNEESPNEVSPNEVSVRLLRAVSRRAEPERLLAGHYIASVREPNEAFITANDNLLLPITHDRFLANPQRLKGEDFQVYMS